MRALLLVAAVVFAGCSDAADTQYLPVGSRCSSMSQCGTSPFDCQLTGFPGGYCTRPCTTDGDCPLDSLCSAHQCGRRCTSDGDCRQDEGYGCKALSSSTAVCAPVPAPMDLGPPSG